MIKNALPPCGNVKKCTHAIYISLLEIAFLYYVFSIKYCRIWVYVSIILSIIKRNIFLILLILLISKELVYHTIFHCTVFIVLLFYLYCTLCIYLLSPLITSPFMSLKIHSFKITHLSLYIFFLFAGDVYKRECRITAH